MINSRSASQSAEVQAQSNDSSSKAQHDTQNKTKPSQGQLTTAPGTRPKRFHFTDAYDLFLTCAVRKEDAHIPKWADLEPTYEGVLKAFLKHVPPTAFMYMNHLLTKTLIDRVMRLISMRRAANKKTLAASGITKEFVEKESLLDDLILEIDEEAEATRVLRERKSENEQSLTKAEEFIWQKALKLASKTDERDNKERLQSKVRPKKRTKREQLSRSDDAIGNFLIEQARESQRLDAERVKLERERLDVQRKGS
ncbi:hypothetical protein BWQ96_08969 [Gracilariopsis chorda]|uniref:Uncharacterized protein n=1 Tax=Gracilariopsis chorda TaxID=448386 RepID=A0A2V3IGS9_9FLOR|nr:hypothetical protein BWQ96_08969 [Gracilariopsis chorda]|eukprot:PXF41294.1 hypothetical protein BWQ96_08969 [Gracilariopsis chorda]